MSLINVTTWAARKRHLADIDDAGKNLPTLCSQWALTAGHLTCIGTITQQRIDALEPCKKCEKRRDAIEAVHP